MRKAFAADFIPFSIKEEYEGRKMEKAVAVELDDVLNDFSAALGRAGIVFDPMRNSLRDPLLRACLYDWRSGALSPTAEQAMRNTKAKPGAAEFLRGLAAEGFETVLFSERDFRFCYGETAAWLHENGMPCRHLFSVDDMGAFCVDMKIKDVVSRRPLPSFRFRCLVPLESDAAFPAYANVLCCRGFPEVLACLKNG